MEKNILTFKKWVTFYETIKKELDIIQNKALSDYTNNYGPYSSAIQNRLRPVYNFGDLKLKPEKGKIFVKVKRNGEEIFPNDYFSESQIQIVMLSLFLSAALTQNWSSFLPILMDDPVEHFDDINSYSFVELIRGLVMDSSFDSQIILSTCENKLYKLLKQKLGRLDKKVIFYEFKSIDKNGPVIEKL